MPENPEFSPIQVDLREESLAIEGIVVEDETRRFYQLGNAACEVLGRTNLDNVGADGLEYQYEDALAGRVGWTTTVPTGRSTVSLRLPGAEGRPARDGASLELTIDGDLQAIVENHLSRAVDSLKAKRGFAIFLDPWSGEILAAACAPHLPPGAAKNWNFTDQYEPGSTFKAVTMGAGLATGRITPSTKVEVGDSWTLYDGVLHDAHPDPGVKTAAEALRVSSNIGVAKLAYQHLSTPGQDRKSTRLNSSHRT